MNRFHSRIQLKNLFIQETEFFDVPKKLFTGIPLKIFIKCKKYRKDRERNKLRHLCMTLKRRFPENILKIECVVSLFEMIELLRRNARRSKQHCIAYLMAAGKLRQRVGPVEFSLYRLHDAMRSSKSSVDEIINSQNILLWYLNDAYS
ncbi:unnamed protein product [Thelazia callipaeda]|uniref:Replication initiation protein n=1 Tax=Thelazia callipaeda TaxID=103827 RepID=A0A0N5CTX8_THECL|nr:unnamed protein product [Thelazia callipaeda]